MRHSGVGRAQERRRESAPWVRRLLGACLAATLATATGGLAISTAFADDGSVVEPASDAAIAGDTSGTEALAPETAPEPALEPAPDPAPGPAPEDPAAAESEPASVEPAPVVLEPAEPAPAEPAPAPESEPAAAELGVPEAPASDAASAAADEVTILVDTAGPGPSAGDIEQPRFRAAHPDTYTTANPGTADTSNVQTQLTSNTQNRFFECGDTIIYFQIIPIAADAPS
ncbi:hypothetical protein L1785_22065, partial [Antribacter sp. KLBMP9083]|nr:hypothetical protein [Antribacter soli]